MDLTENYWTNWVLVTLPSLRERYKAVTINRVLAHVRRALRLGVRRWKRRTYENLDGGTAISRSVFHRNNGRKIGDIHKTWANTCKEAGLVKALLDKNGNVITTEVDGKETAVMIPSKLFHDFRRTASRDTYMATGKKECSKAITGHKTDAMFDPYNIVDDQNVRLYKPG
jgi:hypothetical protein